MEFKTMTRIGTVALALALGSPLAGQQPSANGGGFGAQVAAPAPWIQEDPGSQVYAQAREALNAARYTEAARRFQELRERYPSSGYVGDSYYWQAFALYREGGRTNFRAALDLLNTQAERYTSAATRADASQLKVRIDGQLAQRGDASAAAAISQQATNPCVGEEQELRMAALSALLGMNPDQALPILQEVLRSRDACSGELRQQAVFLIAQDPTDESVDILLDLAHRNPDPDPEVRQQAVFWLSQVDSDLAVDALTDILRETEDPDLQEQALFALAQSSSDRASQTLREYAQRRDADPEVRRNAIFWIAQSGHAEANSYLRQIYGTLDDPELKENILMGLANSGDPESAAWIMERARDGNEDPEVRQQAVFWLGESGALKVSDLRSFFDSFQDSEMKQQIIFVASQQQESGGVDFLMDVARTEKDPEVRQQAIFWLGQSKDPRVPEFLLSIIRR